MKYNSDGFVDIYVTSNLHNIIFEAMYEVNYDKDGVIEYWTRRTVYFNDQNKLVYVSSSYKIQPKTGKQEWKFSDEIKPISIDALKSWIKRSSPTYIEIEFKKGNPMYFGDKYNLIFQ